jgi:glycosyltransferase involved in cell wall biosynthesis
MSRLVTIAIPIYKRLEYLPGVLRAVELQNYPNIELIVSDNGQNGSKVTELIDRHFSRPYRFRQNAVTVNIPSHYHQILSEATGEYFIWLADDDLISPNFVSELADTLENHPEVSVAIARQEIIDTTGRVVRRSSEDVPVFLSGEEFIRSWTKYKYENYSTLLARTEDLKACGGFANFPRGTASDDAIMIKLCLKGSVAFNTRCAFQYRWHETSHGFSISLQQLADDLKNFLRFLDSDPIIRSYAAQNPTQWTELKATLVTMTWQTYHSRWDTLYRERLALVPWVKAAFALPYIPDYYRAVRSSLRHGVKEKLFRKAKAQFPWIHKLYRTIKRRTF